LQSVERSALVKYTAEQMFALVNDVASYPQFLPWCTAASVQVVSAEQVVATVKVERSVLRTHFTTRNTLTAGRVIAMQLVEGPFSRLSGEWRFDPIAAEGSKVRFKVDFEFSNRLLAAGLNPVFESVCAAMVGAFVERAKSVYG
jgi:ribosome-associated toxin RatA of RatAB toxin-antitoxin module